MNSAQSGVTAAEAELAATRSAIADPSPVEARIAEAEATLAEAELAVRDCTIRAPFDCHVVGLNLAKGAFVNPGINALMILDTREWHVNADFSENIIGKIRPGQAARVQLMSAPDVTFEGRVESIGWAVTSMPELPLAQIPFVRRELDWVRLTQRYPVRVRLTSPDIPPDILRAGVTASVTVLTDGAP
jgi:multidrug efflux system membrane fusion protein